MKQAYQNLSDLLQGSIPAEAFWAQLPEHIQQQAMAHQGQIHTVQELRAFAQRCRREG